MKRKHALRVQRSNQWLMLLFTILLQLPFVLWLYKEDEGLLPETVAVIVCAWIITFLSAVSLPLRAWLKRLIEAVLLFAAYYVMFVDQLPKAGGKGIRAWLQSTVPHIFEAMMPFVLFGIGAWLLYLALIWSVQERWRIYWMIGIGLLALAFRDSFSEVVLWQETALFLFSGLSLLVLHHFSRMKPSRSSIDGSRSSGKGRSIFIFIPIGILFIITSISGYLAPNVNNLLTDPYTLWKGWRGEEVNLPGKKTIDVPGGLNRVTSGYGRDDSRLGGAFNFDYSTIMRVETTGKAYWRGETRSIYTGQGWRSTESEGGKGWRPAEIGTYLPNSRQEQVGLEYTEIQQNFSIEGNVQLPILFGAYSISEVNVESPLLGKLFWAEESSFIGVDLALPSLNQYTITSRVPILTSEKISQVAENVAYESWMDDYLQLPNTVTDRVRQLAEEITSEATTAFEKAQLIEEYLSTNYRYTNRPNDNGNDSMDFVDRFLFEIEEGYCDYFSTAMVVMARMLELPARWVKGFTPGVTFQTDGISEDRNPGIVDNTLPSGMEVYSVRNADAHSWVEIYFPELGWVAFEPTAGYQMPSAVADPQQTAEPSPSPSPVATNEPASPTPTPDTGNKQSATEKASSSIAWIVLIVGLAAAIVWFSFSRYSPFRQTASHGRNIDYNTRMIASFNDWLKKAGKQRDSVVGHETARETLERWQKLRPEHSEQMAQLLLLFEQAKYSTEKLTQEQWQMAQHLMKQLLETKKKE